MQPSVKKSRANLSDVLNEVFLVKAARSQGKNNGMVWQSKVFQAVEMLGEKTRQPP